MQDVSPELLNRIRSDFKEACRADKELGQTIDKIDGGKGTYREAQDFASSIGDKLGEAYKKNLTPESLPDGRLYRNIAEKVIRPTLHDNYELVSDASQKVQKALNDEAGIGLRVQIPEEDIDRVDGIIDRVSDHVDEFTSETADDLASMTENFTHHVVDAFIEKNADFQYNAGLKPKIERDAMAECCGWCLDLAGTYEYPLKDRSVFQRHKECRCVVDYHPGNGKVQNAHTKQWRDETDSDILEARKTIGLEPLVDPAKIEERKQAEKSKDATGYADDKFDRKVIVSSRDEDLKAVNPNYSRGKESGYQTNCQRCCPTYLLRRQGYDVIANPDNFGHDKNIEFILHYNHRVKYVKADGTYPVVHFTRGSKTHGKTEIEQFMSDLPDGALCEVSCAWNPKKVQGGAHVFLAQKDGDFVKYMDPQTGEEDVSRYFDLMMKDRTDFIRIDDTKVNEDYIWYIARNKR